jgi:hypothetical protein
MVLAFGSLLTARDSAAQVMIPDSLCVGCSAHIERELEIQTDLGEVVLSATAVARSGGRLAAGPSYTGQIAVLDVEGALLGAVGRLGDGPGEFTGLLTALRVGPDGTLYALHSNRITRIDPWELAVLDQIRLRRRAMDVHPLPDGRVLYSPQISDLLAQGPHLVSLSASGEEEGHIQLPASGGRPSSENPYPVLRTHALSGDSAVWSARTNRYAFELVGLDGSVLASFERVAPWFPEGTYEPGGPFLHEPHPQIRALREDAAGRLWVLIWTASRDWQPVDMGDRPRRTGDLNPSDFFDTVLEVLDAHAGQVLVRERLNGAHRFVEGHDGRIWTTELTSTGEPVIVVRSVTF